MVAPSLISARKLPHALRLRSQVVLARAWEALTETYRLQAVEFVRRLGPRLPASEALDRYFREVGIPSAMEDAVRARAVIALAPLMQSAVEP